MPQLHPIVPPPLGEGTIVIPSSTVIISSDSEPEIGSEIEEIPETPPPAPSLRPSTRPPALPHSTQGGSTIVITSTSAQTALTIVDISSNTKLEVELETEEIPETPPPPPAPAPAPSLHPSTPPPKEPPASLQQVTHEPPQGFRSFSRPPRSGILEPYTAPTPPRSPHS